MNLTATRWRGATTLIFAAIALVGATPGLMAQSRIRARSVEVFDSQGAYLGIEMEDVTADNMAAYKLTSERGVIVRSVEKGSPAETAGIMAKDVILEIAGVPVLSTMQFSRLVREMPAGRKVDMAVSREGKRMNLSAKLGKRDGAESRMLRVVPGRESDRELEIEGPHGRVFGFRMPEGRSFAFRMPELRGMLESSSERPRLGVTIQPLTDQMAEFLGVPGKKGVLVTGTVEGSPAVGKLKAGDVIVRADDHSVESPEDLTEAVGKKEAGGKLELRIVRDRKEISLAIELSPSDEKSKSKRGYRLE